MARRPEPLWWEIRRAQSHKPSTYRCPLCGRPLPALSEHMLMFPEGDHSRRRHAHSRCVIRERQAGRLRSREEWQRTQPRPPSLITRLLTRLAGRAGGDEDVSDQ